MTDNRSGFMTLAIVGIVAIVALVFLTMGAKQPVYPQEDLLGQATMTAEQVDAMIDAGIYVARSDPRKQPTLAQATLPVEEMIEAGVYVCRIDPKTQEQHCSLICKEGSNDLIVKQGGNTFGQNTAFSEEVIDAMIEAGVYVC